MNYVWLTLGVIAGILLLYALCLRKSQNDWTVAGRIPPGPWHIPVIGCLGQVLCASNQGVWMEKLITTYGPVVRCCLPGRKVVLAQHGPEVESLARQGAIIELTVQEYVFRLLEQIGLGLKVSQELVAECRDLSCEFYNYTLSTQEFALLLDSAENYRQALHEKKVQDLLSSVLKRRVLVEKSERILISKGFHKTEKFKEYLEKSRPALWLSFANHAPHVFFERKRINKILRSLKADLTEIFRSCGGVESDDFTKFFVLYILIGLSSTSPKKKSTTSQNRADRNPEAIIAEDLYQPCFDIVGLRFFHTVDYINLLEYDIPGKTLIITTANSSQAGL